MLLRLKEFGDIVKYYEGTGYLSQSDGDQRVECQFIAAQYAKGDIRVVFQNDIMFDIQSSSIKFQGKTINGLPVNINGSVIVEYSRHHSSKTETNTNSHYQIEIILNGAATMTCGTLDQKNAEFRFGIVNFEFLGTQSIQIDEKTNSLARLDLNVDGVEVYIDHLYDYKAIMKDLKANRQYAITSIMRISADQCDFEEAKTIVSLICDLLAIARGRRINWLYLEAVDTNGEVTYREHYTRITTPFTGIELIDRMPAQITKDFIEECYPTCSHRDFPFEISTLANLVADIRSSGFIESRCLSICSLIEHLYKRTTSKKNCLNHKIKLVRDTYTVPLDDEEIKKFVGKRNKLVHELKLDRPQEDYHSLLHFFDRILLRILGYTGYYINATNLPIYSGEKGDKLLP